MKKKLITLLLMTVTVASLVACGEKVDTDTDAPSQAAPRSTVPGKLFSRNILNTVLLKR